jgi:hypothetical protein
MPFKPGQSGNPSGRPKKNKELEQLIQKALQNVKKGKASESGNRAIDRLLKIMESGSAKDSVAAAKLVMAYAYGSPSQQIYMDANIGHSGWRDRVEAWKQSKKKKKPRTSRS